MCKQFDIGNRATGIEADVEATEADVLTMLSIDSRLRRIVVVVADSWSIRAPGMPRLYSWSDTPGVISQLSDKVV